ncbi:hypothetical protein MOQ_004813 [Trypanosoma cruzi marinkellei]|uniref:Transmembrane protein n=1 Tax=Trypanosoma cruzi marinkellei TaxID=85056 RepID=K2MZZ5_TRYCR|nr:hypothetical protein MOQ_004813 [Trypanosoma cruzi marinkellei]
MRRRRPRSTSTRSGEPGGCRRVGGVWHQEKVEKSQSSLAPSLAERPANTDRLSKHGKMNHGRERRSQLALREELTHPSDASSSSSSLRQLRDQPVFCLPHYRWSPLHTSYAQDVVREHEAVIRWYEEKLRPCDVKIDGEFAVAWLATARCRRDALRNFVQEHRSLYGSLDAEKLQEVEACLLRLSLCVKRAEQNWNLGLFISSLGTPLGNSRTAPQETVAREKHISFARPLSHFFSSAPLAENEDPMSVLACPFLAEGNTADGDENSTDAPYTGRTSGVYYGNISSLPAVVNAVSSLQYIHDDEANTSSWQKEKREQGLGGVIATEDGAENVTTAVSFPYGSLPSLFFVSGPGGWRRRELQGLWIFLLYIFLLTTCCLLLLLAAFWRWS